MSPTQERPAVESTGGGRTQHPAAANPRAAAEPVSASPRGASAGRSLPGAPVPGREPSSSPAAVNRRHGATAAGDPSPAGGERASRREATSAPPAAQAAIAAAMSEDRGPDSLDAHVRRLIKDLGLRAYHTHDSRRSPSGFPDWVITGKRTIYRELKREGKNPTEAQQDWLDALAAADDDSGVWRPSDLLSGRIQSELVAISWLGGM